MSDLSRYSIIYMPDDPAEVKGVIELIHDFGEHQGRYREFAQFFTGCGYAVITGDLRGHGANINRNVELGYLGDNAASRLVGDIHDNRIYVKEHFPGLPFYIIAVGIGALIGTSYFKKYDNFVNGLFLLGMPSNRKNDIAVSLFLKLMIALKGEYHRSKLMDSLVFGAMRKSISGEPSDCSWLSNDQDVITQYKNDQKCGFTFTLNAYTALFDLFNYTYTRGSWIHKKTKCPIRIFAGSNDPYIPGKSALARAAHLFSDNGYADVAYMQYPGQCHDLLHGSDRDEVYNDLLEALGKISRTGTEDEKHEDPSRIDLEDFIDPDIDKPIEKEEKINLEDFINSKSEKNPSSRSKVEMIDYQDINTNNLDIDLENIISSINENADITYEPVTESEDTDKSGEDNSDSADRADAKSCDSNGSNTSEDNNDHTEGDGSDEGSSHDRSNSFDEVNTHTRGNGSDEDNAHGESDDSDADEPDEVDDFLKK